MVACIYKRPFKCKSPQKRGFSIWMKSYKKQSYKKHISLHAPNKQSFNKQPSKKQMCKSFFFVHNIKMLISNISLNGLKTFAKIKGIIGSKAQLKRD